MTMLVFGMLIAGIILGAVCGFLYARTKTAAFFAQLEERSGQIEEKTHEVQLLRAQVEAKATECADLQAERSSLLTKLELMTAQMTHEMEAKEAQFHAQDELLLTKFKNLANDILDQKSKGLKETNTEQLQPLFFAIKEQMTKVDTTLRQTREDNVSQKASLDKAMEAMIARTMEVGIEADKLATALRGGDKKKQGIYGELILTKILEDSGLKNGVNFHCQQMIRDQGGQAVRNEDTDKKMIPDVVVHFDGRDLVIDAKTSLTAYVDWCNAETEEGRQEAAHRHLQSIRSHIDELQTVSYPAYLKTAQRTTIDYAVMFIPNEGAFQLMMQEEPSLWHDAYDRKIIITSQLALFSMLRLIQVSWLHIEQQRNQEQILKHASLMLKRVAEFNKYFEEIGAKLTAATNSFAAAKGKLIDGQQSIAVSGRKLQELNVKFDDQRPLPEPEMSLLEEPEKE
ncbi:MAG: DNA recombination protein RmuC [Alistipes sp.]